MKKNIFIILLVLASSAFSFAQKQKGVLDVTMNYDKNTNNLVVILTNNSDSELLFVNDHIQGSALLLKFLNAAGKDVYYNNYAFVKDGTQVLTRFMIQPREVMVCTYYIPDLIQNPSKESSFRKLEVEAWIKYGIIKETKVFVETHKQIFDY